VPTVAQEGGDLSLFTRRLQEDQGTVFSVQFGVSKIPNSATPEEYFEAMQEAFSEAAANGGSLGAGMAGGGGIGLGGGGIGGTTGAGGTTGGTGYLSFLTAVTFDQAIVSRTMKVCDMEPFWEKGQTVYDLKNCRLSPVCTRYTLNVFVEAV
ncbi:unnamed protein product, partial [Polarella glacialis]